MKVRIIFLLLSLTASTQSLAAVCHNFTHSITNVNYDLTASLTKEQNRWGRQLNWLNHRMWASTPYVTIIRTAILVPIAHTGIPTR